MAFQQIKSRLRRRRLRRSGFEEECGSARRSYGDRTGVWTIRPDAITPDSVVYSFGVGNNIAWDLAMIREHGVELHAFDPTPRSVAWLKTQDLPERFRFHELGLAYFDGDLALYPPEKEHKIHFSTTERKSSAAEPILCKVERLTTIASRLGHERIDVLKMDIEGAEMEALPDVLQSGLPVGQLLVEFHYNYPAISFRDTVALMQSIREHGFRILWISERGYEFSFIHESLLEA